MTARLSQCMEFLVCRLCALFISIICKFLDVIEFTVLDLLIFFILLQYSLPLPQGGRDGITKNPILREDQLPQKFLYPKTKKKNKQVYCHLPCCIVYFINYSLSLSLRSPTNDLCVLFCRKMTSLFRMTFSVIMIRKLHCSPR